MRPATHPFVRLAILLAPPLSAGAQSFPEYEAKAAFLYTVASFVTWPEVEPPGSDSAFVIGVLGRDLFGQHLDRLENETISGRPIRIIRFSDARDVTGIHILVISASERRRLDQIVRALSGRPILTVGEGSDFAERGGMIRWFIQDERLRLEINRCAAERAGLRIRSRLLRQSRPPPKDCPAGEE